MQTTRFSTLQTDDPLYQWKLVSPFKSRILRHSRNHAETRRKPTRLKRNIERALVLVDRAPLVDVAHAVSSFQMLKNSVSEGKECPINRGYVQTHSWRLKNGPPQEMSATPRKVNPIVPCFQFV